MMAAAATLEKPSQLRPIQTPDGTDNPAGQQKNRRVEIIIRTR
jgi:flagellar motor protein MotB